MVDDMSEGVVVGIGEYAVVEGETPISTIGLGSCVGIVLYDRVKKITGLSHIMLPYMENRNDRIGKYADAAIPALIEEMVKRGANRQNLKAKIAGGASIFTFEEDHLQIGKRNVEAVRETLRKHGVHIEAEDVGGNRGRTITFYPRECKLHIRVVRRGADGPTEKTI